MLSLLVRPALHHLASQELKAWPEGEIVELNIIGSLVESLYAMLEV
jgi:hypothetical protein